MALPTYYLSEAIGNLTTRWAPLSLQAISEIHALIQNAPELSGYTNSLVGLSSPENSMTFWPSLANILNNQTFLDAASSRDIASHILRLLEYMSFTLETMTQKNIDDLFTIIGLTPQFSAYAAQLSGLTPANCRNTAYMSVYEILCSLPKFKIDAVGYAV